MPDPLATALRIKATCAGAWASISKHSTSYLALAFYVLFGAFQAFTQPDSLMPMLFGFFAARGIRSSIKVILWKPDVEKKMGAAVLTLIANVITNRKFVGEGPEVTSSQTYKVGNRNFDVIVRDHPLEEVVTP